MNFIQAFILCVSFVLIYSKLSFCFTCTQKNEEYLNYDIDLDKPAFERWKEPAIAMSSLWKKVLKYFLLDTVPKDIVRLIEIISNDLEKYLPHSYVEEINGFAHYGNLNTTDVVFFNLYYEAQAWCTSIVTTDPNNQLWHARNFDFGNNAEQTGLLKNMTALIRYTRGGKVVYSSLSTVGYMGIHTGIKHGAFSITIDERDKGSWIENLWAAINEILRQQTLMSVGIVIREAIDMSNSFKEIVTHLTAQRLVAPVYFIIGGLRNNEGAIITRDRNNILDLYRLNLSQNRWYILETNYDRWVEPPASDNRRKYANQAMMKMGRQNITTTTLMNVLSVPFVCNDKTIFSIVMTAANKTDFQVIVRV